MDGQVACGQEEFFFEADMLHFFVVALELEHNHGSNNNLCKRHVIQSYLIDAEGGIFLR